MGKGKWPCPLGKIQECGSLWLQETKGLSPRAKAAWADLRFEMWEECNQGVLTKPATAWSRQIAASEKGTEAILAELAACRVVEMSVTDNKNITLKYAPAIDAYNYLINNRLRQGRFRAKRASNAQAAELTNKLKEYILTNNPKARISENQLENWVKEADLLLRIDGRDFEEAQQILAWCQQDFCVPARGKDWSGWANVILSMGKFRQQYDQLKQRMNSQVGPHSRSVPQSAGYDLCATCGCTRTMHNWKKQGVVLKGSGAAVMPKVCADFKEAL